MVKKIIMVVAAVLAMTTTAYADPVGEGDNPYRFIEISEQEMQELRLIVSAEAQTQGTTGMVAVTECILNRVISDRFPNTVHDVLSQRGQFATWKKHSWAVPELADEAIEVVLDNGPVVLPSTDYVYFSRGKQKYAKDHIKIVDHWFGK